MPLIKFCGLTNAEDALAAIEAGADLLGFNFYSKSPRFIQPDACARIVAEISRSGVSPDLLRLGEPGRAGRPRLGLTPSQGERPSYNILLVGVFVNTPAIQVQSILADCGLDLAQLSGDEPPQDLDLLGERGFKAIRSAGGATLAETSAKYPVRSSAPAFLVDATKAGEYGGTGQVADWDQARELARRCPILLAGGLRPENVAEAVRQVRPWGVDTASGIESAPGKKDFQKMMAFAQAVRLAFQEEGC